MSERPAKKRAARTSLQQRQCVSSPGQMRVCWTCQASAAAAAEDCSEIDCTPGERVCARAPVQAWHAAQRQAPIQIRLEFPHQQTAGQGAEVPANFE